MTEQSGQAFWTTRSLTSVFAGRRRRLMERLAGPILLASGIRRVRNFRLNLYPLRSESHFLYLVGRHFDGSFLLREDDRWALYTAPPDPADTLWTGPTPGLDELVSELGIEVLPLSELSPPADCACLPPQDTEAADWLSQLLDRDIDAGMGAEVVDADAELADAMIELRLKHDDGAMAQLRQAATVTVAAHRAGMSATRGARREAHVTAAMESVITASGMTTAYHSIVSVRGDILHNESHEGQLHDGELILADVGAESLEGFAGDGTRVWPVNGRFSTTQRELYDVVLRSQLEAIEQIRPGQRYLEVHRTAARTMLQGLVELGICRGDPAELYERGVAGVFFPHGVGHLLGLDVHDMEDLGDRAGYAPGRERLTAPGDAQLRLDRDLEAGMAVTVEPGFYQVAAILEDETSMAPFADAIDRAQLAKFSDVRGIRIEDDVLVTDQQPEVLTAALGKTADEIEDLMAPASRGSAG